MEWLKSNATTLVGWCVVISLALGARLASLDETQSALSATRNDVTVNTSRITALESDVRLLSQTVHRQEQAVLRQENAQKDLDRLVTELRTIVEYGRDR